MQNTEIADRLDELADLYELDGAVIYRIVAYRQAADRVRETAVSVAELAEASKLTEFPGIGATLQQKIQALVETGEIPAAEKLKRKWPAGLLEIMRLPGVGAKTARKLYEELGVSDARALHQAAESGEIRALPGFGVKKEENILKGLEQAKRLEGGRILLSKALPLAEELVRQLREHPAAEAVDIAGSARRMAETCHDLDLVTAAKDANPLLGAFVNLPEIERVIASGETGVRAVSHMGIMVDLRVVSPKQYGNLLQHLSGSQAHNIELREAAVKQGMHVSEYGIEDDRSGETHTCQTEEEVYRLLGLDYIVPELREDRGELDAAREGRLPELVGYGDIKGELHSHTTLTDGRNSLEEMAEAARARGLKYLAITDHSATYGFGKGVQPEKLLEQAEQVRKLDGEMKGLKLLAGSEVNVLPDGSLDYGDEVLAKLDWVIASVHSSFQMDKKRMTERLLAAADHPLVDAIGHPTGRLILERAPYAVDIQLLIERCAETKTMLEINANPRRRDLSEDHARMASEAGVKIVINTDAHSVEMLGLTRYGVATARRAWLTAEDVANTRSWREFSKLRKRRRFVTVQSPPIIDGIWP